MAKENRDLRYISFFLHHYEPAMNKQIRRFLLSNCMANQPERFLDMKLACMEVLLKKFPDYDSEKNAAFTTYLSKFLRDAMLACRMQEEAWSLSSLSVYKGVRLMAAVYAQSHENSDAALESFMQRTHCTLETAKPKIRVPSVPVYQPVHLYTWYTYFQSIPFFQNSSASRDFGR